MTVFVNSGFIVTEIVAMTSLVRYLLIYKFLCMCKMHSTSYLLLCIVSQKVSHYRQGAPHVDRSDGLVVFVRNVSEASKFCARLVKALLNVLCVNNKILHCHVYSYKCFVNPNLLRWTTRLALKPVLSISFSGG